MSRFWSELVSRLTPYVPGEQPQLPNLVKLNTNENPYPPSPKALAALAAMDTDALRRYPDPESLQLRQVLADYHRLAVEQVFVGNGSDEVLAHTFQALLSHGGPLRFPDVTYSFYPVWCGLYGIDYRTVPLTEDFRVDPANYLPGSSPRVGGILLSNPNAPTGVLASLAELRTLLQTNPDQLVVIDEAYIDFGGESAVPLIDDFDNLLVIQTFSKSRSLAGLRVGVALGHRDLIEALERVKNSFNSYPLDVVAQRVAVASLQDDDYFQACCSRVIASREQLALDLKGMGFTLLPSVANFLFASHPDHHAAQLFAKLRDRGILLRHFQQPRIAEFLRISVGTEAQNRALMEALGEIL